MLQMEKMFFPFQRQIRILAGTSFSISDGTSGWLGTTVANKVLSIILAAAILATVAAIIYLGVTPHVTAKFTEFYILGSEGKAEGYPRDVKAGDAATVTVGIINHEDADVTYRVDMVMNGMKIGQAGPLPVVRSAKWEQTVNFVPTHGGDNQKVQILLYKEGAADPDLSLNLWINVK